jgi:hypothetical protein
LQEVLSQIRRQEVTERRCIQHSAPWPGLAGEGQELAVAAKQAGDVALKGAGFGAVETVTGAGGADAGAAFFRARAGALAAVQAAAAVAHGGGAAGAAGAAGAGAAARGEVGVAAGVAVAEGTGALTVQGVLRGSGGGRKVRFGGLGLPHLTPALSAPTGAERELWGPLTVQGVLR